MRSMLKSSKSGSSPALSTTPINSKHFKCIAINNHLHEGRLVDASHTKTSPVGCSRPRMPVEELEILPSPHPHGRDSCLQKANINYTIKLLNKY